MVENEVVGLFVFFSFSFILFSCTGWVGLSLRQSKRGERVKS